MPELLHARIGFMHRQPERRTRRDGVPRVIARAHEHEETIRVHRITCPSSDNAIDPLIGRWTLQPSGVGQGTRNGSRFCRTFTCLARQGPLSFCGCLRLREVVVRAERGGTCHFFAAFTKPGMLYSLSFQRSQRIICTLR